MGDEALWSDFLTNIQDEFVIHSEDWEWSSIRISFDWLLENICIYFFSKPNIHPASMAIVFRCEVGRIFSAYSFNSIPRHWQSFSRFLERSVRKIVIEYLHLIDCFTERKLIRKTLNLNAKVYAVFFLVS